MSTTTKSVVHTPGAMRAAKLMAISPKVRQLALGIILREEFSQEMAEIIDRETAAPEMLEALEGLITWAATHGDLDFSGTGESYGMIREWKIARAAIRKARKAEVG